MTPDDLLDRLRTFVPVLLSLSVHEWAHAYAAFRLGDDTAARMGRMTLNPIAHIDPVGTLLLPLLGVPFGWAKPVPVNPVRFDRSVSMGTGMAITAAAGPASNFVLAALSLLVLGAMHHFGALQPGLLHLFVTLAIVNVSLGVFNLFPISPLDGSRIAEAFVPYGWRSAWDAWASAGPFLLFALIAAPRLLGVSLLAWPMAGLMSLLSAIFR
ncbi:MAG TPA: site-2 protease family protein [Myxococcota bacterium]|nr:site-2 protease family protein [Myxococcota bacterium]